MNDLDSAVVTAVTHGSADDLVRLGFKAEWIVDPDARLIYRQSLDFLHRTPPVKPNRINILSSCYGELQDPKEVKVLISLNGAGEIVPDVVARKCQERYLTSQARHLNEKFDSMLQGRSGSVNEWLPRLAQEYQTLVSSGRAYNPTPSAHKGAIVAPVNFKSGLRTYNELFAGQAGDGGGYRHGWWMVWLGITGRGKTTHSYTQSVDAINQKKRVVFVSKENQSHVRARILLGLTGLTMPEISADIASEQPPLRDGDGNLITLADKDGNILGPWGDAVVRGKVLQIYSELLDKHLLLFDWSFCKSAEIKSIISIEEPDLMHIDYFDAQDVTGNDKINGLGKISRLMEDIAHNSQTHINGYWQISAAERKLYEHRDDHAITGPYGSSSVGHAADQMVQTKWGREQFTQHILRTKCRAGGLVRGYFMAYDKARWIYKDRLLPSNAL